jgi:hypothetical protein
MDYTPDKVENAVDPLIRAAENPGPQDLGQLVLGVLMLFQFVSFRISKTRKLLSAEIDGSLKSRSISV